MVSGHRIGRGSRFEVVKKLNKMMCFERIAEIAQKRVIFGLDLMEVGSLLI